LPNFHISFSFDIIIIRHPDVRLMDHLMPTTALYAVETNSQATLIKTNK